jgi:hypothetical protein
MHVVFVSDIYEMEVAPENREKVGFFHGELGLSLDILSKAGFGKLREKVVVWVQTISGSLTLEMTYERTSDGLKLGEVTDGRNISIGRFKFF